MNIDDVKKAKAEAEKFIAFVDDLLRAEATPRDYYYNNNNPAECGLVKAQSIILSRQLSAMRNPYTCKRGKRK